MIGPQITTTLLTTSRNRFWLAIYLFSFVVLSLIKAPQVLIETRFWAEEGSVYFAQMSSLPMRDALLFVTNANYQLLTNLLVFAATRVPLANAPAVTTYGAFLVAVLIVVLIFQITIRYRLNRVVGLLLVIAWVFLPGTYETVASATNVQWICSISMLLVLLLPSEDIERNLGKLVIWTALCGLTGVPSCMLAPGFLFRAVYDRSKAFFILGAILSVCALVQLIILKLFGATGRSFAVDVEILTLPALLQTVLVPLFGAGRIARLAEPIREGTATIWPYVVAYGAALVLMLVSISIALRAQRAAIVMLLLFLWVLVTVLNSFGAIGPPRDLISATFGARYYLLGSVCFCLLLVFGTAVPGRIPKIVTGGLLGLIVVSSAAERIFLPWMQPFFEGPSWRVEVEKCRPDAPCDLAIWPPSWIVRVQPPIRL